MVRLLAIMTKATIFTKKGSLSCPLALISSSFSFTISRYAGLQQLIMLPYSTQKYLLQVQGCLLYFS